jgi:hypothetical protein
MPQNAPLYAVFFFPQALEALGAAIEPYLTQSAAGPHLLCNEVDTSGSFCEFVIRGNGQNGPETQQLELLIPSQMVRLIASIHSDIGRLGFNS